MANKPESMIKALESNFNVTLPQRYKFFLTESEYEKYSEIKFIGSFIRGDYKLDFIDPVLEDPDLEVLGEKSGIYDMDFAWEKDYKEYVPIALVKGSEYGSGMFLVINITKSGNPVLVFDGEWALYPVSTSFDEFLKALPTIEATGILIPWQKEKQEEIKPDIDKPTAKIKTSFKPWLKKDKE